jgi:L-cysteine S-thiosulfotransferase
MKPTTALRSARWSLLPLLAVLGACSTGPNPKDVDAAASSAIMGSFRDEGIAKTDRLKQDATQALCSQPTGVSDNQAARIMAAEAFNVKWPDGGRYFGDISKGEKLAQSGRGMTWTDPDAQTKSNGGNCYNCHQLDKKELSFGTIGPSLWNYGKLRGVKDLNDPASAPIIQYTWGKLWNAKAYAACSSMPRFGHQALLDQGQIRDLMSLLLDPKSPVNQ